MIDTCSVVVPVFNDWVSLQILLENLNAVAKEQGLRLSILAVDDGSTEPGAEALDVQALTHLQSVELVHLALNMGHQRAIAVGLCVAVRDYDLDAVLVMDSDGEDLPESIVPLAAAAGDQTDFCVVARRRKRTEKLSFRVGYLVYKFLFKLVTGREINFGNFSLTSRGHARRLVMISDLWNNLAAAMLRSRLPVQRVPVDRGHRYAGSSKMNFVSLVVHGFSGISVYAETIFVRLLLATGILGVLTLVTILVLLILRIFLPQHATPGWATTVSFSMIIILTQVLMTALASLLMLLNSRVQKLIIPAEDYHAYVGKRRMLLGVRPEPIDRLVSGT